MPEATTYDPATDSEKVASARAVIEERKSKDMDELVESLSIRERALIERAWEAGANTARDALANKLANPQAATLDAKAVAGIIAGWRDTPDLFVFKYWGRDVGQHHDSRIARLVRSALKEAEHMERGKL